MNLALLHSHPISSVNPLKRKHFPLPFRLCVFPSHTEIHSTPGQSLCHVASFLCPCSSLSLQLVASAATTPITVSATAPYAALTSPTFEANTGPPLALTSSPPATSATVPPTAIANTIAAPPAGRPTTLQPLLLLKSD